MSQLGFDNYTFVGDITLIAICAVLTILLLTSYVSRTRSFRIFMNIIILLVCAAAVNIFYQILLRINDPASYNLIYVMRVLYHALLFDIFFLFTLYTSVVSGMEHKKARAYAIISAALLVVIVISDIILTAGGYGFRITEDGIVVSRTNLFLIGYILYIILLLIMMRHARSLLYKRVVYGFYGTMAVAVFVRFGQMIFNQASLTTISFVFPVIAMMYIMHSNPYNVRLGAVDNRAMEDMVRNMYAKKEQFVFLSLLLPEFNVEGKELPEEIRSVVRNYAAGFFRKSVLFQIGKAHIILMFRKKDNPDFENRIKRILVRFYGEYRRQGHPYKIVIGESIDDISRKNEYGSLIKSIEREIPENTVHRVGPEDIARFNKEEYILQELTDIYNKKDMDDPRVLAFCQPVFNIKTGEFDTAEALMRLELEKTGMVFPDQFIPLAESHGLIHVLTEIILNKTCREIRNLIDKGFRISRISVNVSVMEMKDDEFCGDFNHIINENSVSGDKIAIELTETRNEEDFLIIKDKIEELHHRGIQFYLDDFGTGYSNMERIMELPFDIIKFDRSLLIASGTGERSEKIVENLAHMFRDMEYSVLYEGVEDDADEARCMEMSASYLQGYKYSRPIPIEKLKDFLPRTG